MRSRDRRWLHAVSCYMRQNPVCHEVDLLELVHPSGPRKPWVRWRLRVLMGRIGRDSRRPCMVSFCRGCVVWLRARPY